MFVFSLNMFEYVWKCLILSLYVWICLFLYVFSDICLFLKKIKQTYSDNKFRHHSFCASPKIQHDLILSRSLPKINMCKFDLLLAKNCNVKFHLLACSQKRLLIRLLRLLLTLCCTSYVNQICPVIEANFNCRTGRQYCSTYFY